MSAYALTVEAGTPLAADPARQPDDDVQADEYELATERLGAAGYGWYEISNWARPGQECRHNLLYWSGGEYLAIGCAAHGHLDGRRFWNHRTPERYLAAVEAGSSPESGYEELDADGRRVHPGPQVYRIWADRIAAAAHHLLHPVEGAAAAVDPSTVAQLEGLVEQVDDRVVLTREGRLLANEVAIRLT